MGVDGRIFPVGTKPSDDGSMFADDWFPIQGKQTDRVGRPGIGAAVVGAISLYIGYTTGKKS